ncbi:MAG: 2-oxoacid:acceptor oxidoreductase family protein [Desulfohalobiaceae bacterium]|nr:2-oxoacid:acceptor oxidoreductase family protein [Desulfohalobiaceae bacterium]
MNTTNERYEIRIAGFGGQGVVTIGRILGRAFAVYEGLNSVNTQSYGPESRGGACRSEVVISSGPIHYPYVRKAHLLVALSQLALDEYGDSLHAEGTLLVDPDTVENVPAGFRGDLYRVPTMGIAREVGNMKFQNSVALGALYWLIQDKIAEESIQKALADSVPPKTLEGNIAAFDQGKTYFKQSKQSK